MVEFHQSEAESQSNETIFSQLDVSNVPDDCPEVLSLGFDEYDMQSLEQQEFLERGGAFLSFACTHTLDVEQARMVGALINLSTFADETRDNFVPIYNMDEDENPFVLVKTVYALPFTNMIDWITPERLASTEYQVECQVPSTVFWDQTRTDTFRFTKPIIPYVYNMTVQFKVSELSLETLDSLVDCVGGLHIEKGLLMERTKRTVPPTIDRCLKVKSALLYTRVNGGVLCHHLTIVMLSSVPSLVAAIVTRYGSLGAKETAETVSRTRRFLRTIEMKF